MQFRRTTAARHLRQTSGLAETRVWDRLRAGRVDGHKFRRQHPIGRFYADFACDRHRLVIEIDGGIHTRDDVILNDHYRQKAIEALGWTVLRFTNEQLLDYPDILIAAIRRHARSLNL
ncbi:endonuclease domain-containing protein [Brevundimonas sp.]|uniref:endonuclease domain-containing protein n=1 Tax=Brevundimonas sp. TaxID=1871086 RepID=UPI002C2B3B83|nr:endonuclease domain-containing protein [Brevundimonas sp.]HWQ87450.1 endonuclease domain-containing protein [Brevundimonas sp.]